ncbi:MAG: VCBS repeat-containing protein, partial [Bdellovibrionales bacterium]|nr:VCBS repeat-containing protein [Bdellovibrionales bacterium]
EVSTSPQYFRIDGRTIDSRSETPPILTSAYVFDSSETVFPRHTDIRGDLHLWLRKVPSNTSQQKNQTYHLRLNGPDLDAVRDTTLHWQMMRNVYRDPTLPPLDPFAAELLAERTSEMLWFLIYRGSQLVSNAANQDAKITVANLMFDSAQYSLVPREISAPEHDTRDLPKFTPIHFEDVTAQSGISQTCTGEWEKKLLGRFRSADEHAGIDLQSFAGSGVAVGDINSDGLLDLFIGGQDCSRLFFNLGDFRFEDRSEQLLPKEMGKTVRHPLLIDLDNDGRLDLVLVQEVPPSQILYQGRSGKFDTVVNLPTDSAAQNVSVFDYDHDGFLDLFVGQYGIGFEPSIAGRNGSASLLFQGQAKRKFQEVSKRAGLITTGWSLASATPDINNDGWLDLFIANDFGEDELFLNNRDGTFRSVADEYNVNDRGNGMSATLVDLNNDLLPDIYVSTIDTFSKQISFKLPKPNDLIPMTTRILSSSFSLAGNQFHLSKAGHPYQSAIAKIFETGDRGWGWSANFVDLDNDFDLDFVLATGWLQGSLAGEQANQLFENIDGRLYLNEAPNGFNFVGSSRAIAAGDFDNDGKTDLVVTNFADVPRIFRNTTTSAGAISNERVVRLRFDDRFPPSKIIGSKALAILQSGKQQVHFFQAGESYLSQSPFETQFAIPKNDTLRELSFISAEGQRIPLKLPELNGNIVISAQILE